MRALPWIAVLFAAAACGAPEPPRERSTSEAAPIIGGTASTAADDFAVIVDVGGATGYECTGTLLAPNLLLTARHCVSPLLSDAIFSCGRDGSVTSGSATLGADVDPASIEVKVGATRPPDSAPPAARGARILHDESPVLCNHDVAFVVLDTRIPGATIAPVRLDDGAAPGETFATIGWGVTELADFPAARVRRAGVKVVDVGPGVDTALDVEIGPDEFVAGESICVGDSGGPAIDAATGALIGVVSRGGNGSGSSSVAATCTGPATANFFTELAPFKSLALDAYAAAGADPWLEGESGPTPIAGDAGASSGGGSKGGCALGARGPDRSTAPLFLLAAIASLVVRRRR